MDTQGGVRPGLAGTSRCNSAAGFGSPCPVHLVAWPWSYVLQHGSLLRECQPICRSWQQQHRPLATPFPALHTLKCCAKGAPCRRCLEYSRACKSSSGIRDRFTLEKPIGWHSFRHSLATNLRSLGVDIKIAQELMRHSSCRTTLDIYTRAVDQQKREASLKSLN
jgi:integrase